MKRGALSLAKAQIEGGVPWGEIVMGRNSLYVCQKCGGEYHIVNGRDPCAFCDGCKDAVLDVLATTIVKINDAQVRLRKSMSARAKR